MVELLNISATLGKHKRNGNSILASKNRAERRKNQAILFLDKPLLGYSRQKFASFLATKGMFNEGYDYIAKAKGINTARKRMKDVLERPYNNIEQTRLPPST